MSNNLNIFLSYKSKDSATAKTIVEFLQACKTNCFYDKKIEGGSNWWPIILEEIRKCDLLIFLFSMNSIESDACMKETLLAKNYGKTIWVISIDQTDPVLAPKHLNEIQIIQWKDSAQNAVRINKLLQQVDKTNINPTQCSMLPGPPVGYILNDIIHEVNQPSSIQAERQDSIVKILTENHQIENYESSVIKIAKILLQQNYLTSSNKLILETLIIGKKSDLDQFIKKAKNWLESNNFHITLTTSPSKIIVNKGRINTPSNIEIHLEENQQQITYSLTSKPFQDIGGAIIGYAINIYLLGIPILRTKNKLTKGLSTIQDQLNREEIII